jgi:hypothetical protein
MPTYRFRDEFTAEVPAPLGSTLSTSGTGATGSWSVTDNNNRAQVIAGRYRVGFGPNDWNDPSIWSVDPITLSDFGALLGTMRVRTELADRAGLFLHGSPAPANPAASAYGLMLSPQTLRVAPGNGEVHLNNYRLRSIDHLIIHIKRPGGGLWTVMANSRDYGSANSYAQGRILWGVPWDHAANLHIGMTAQGNAQTSLDHARVISEEDLPASWQMRFLSAHEADEFGGSGTISGRSLEVGSATWALADGSVNGTVTGGEATNTGNSYWYYNRASNVHITEATFRAGSTDGSAGNMFFGLLFRGTGTAQANFHRYAWFGNRNEWLIWDGAEPKGTYPASNLTPVAGRLYTLRVVDTGTRVWCTIFDHHNETAHHTHMNFNLTTGLSGTRVGLYSGTPDRSDILEFGVMPHVIDVPDILEPLPAIVERDEPIGSDEFTGTNGTPLDERTLTGSGGLTWEQVAGNWEIQNNRAVLNPLHDDARLLVDPGTINRSLETTIALPPNTSDGFAGIMAAYHDEENWCMVIYLSIAAGNEIEIYERINGGTPFVASMCNFGADIGNTTRTMRVDVARVNDDGAERTEVHVYDKLASDGSEALPFIRHTIQGALAAQATRIGLGTHGEVAFQDVATWDEVTVWETVEDEEPSELATPTGFTVTPVSETQINASWNDVPEAEAYQLERQRWVGPR